MLDFQEACKLLADQLKADLSFESYDEDDAGVEGVINLKTGGERRQQMRLEEVTQDEAMFLRLSTVVGKAGRFVPEKYKELLLLNSSLVYGAFALMDGNIVLTETMDRDPVDLRRTARVLQSMAAKADQFERMLFGVDRA